MSKPLTRFAQLLRPLLRNLKLRGCVSAMDTKGVFRSGLSIKPLKTKLLQWVQKQQI
jgi:hypothetical protein